MAEVNFFGETFIVEPHEYALTKFARAGRDIDENSMGALAATLDLLESLIAANPARDGSTDASEFSRFDTVAMKNRATIEDLMRVIFVVQEEATERPTGPVSDSSDGPPTTPQKFESPRVGEAMERFHGRPDMQLALLKTVSA